MTMQELAHVGVFVIAFIAYLLGTAVFGLFVTSPDCEQFTIPAWVTGAVVYALTVTYMWK